MNAITPAGHDAGTAAAIKLLAFQAELPPHLIPGPDETSGAILGRARRRRQARLEERMAPLVEAINEMAWRMEIAAAGHCIPVVIWVGGEPR